MHQVVNDIPQQTWEKNQIIQIYTQPLNDLLFHAHTIHKANHPANTIQCAKLLSIKTGACPEDCSYCSQSGLYKTDIQKEKLISVAEVINAAKIARSQGATRFCMGGAYRAPPKKIMPQLQEMIQQVKALGLETCMTVGLLDASQAQELKDAGLDYYNHNIDTSPQYYEKIITTRTFADRIKTIENVRNAGIAVCCGGILGLGETVEDRIDFLQSLANMPTPPESVPINCLIPVAGTPLANAKPIDSIELVRTIASARIVMPTSVVRLTAGRTMMSDELQAMCYFAGANSIFIGDKLLTEDNPKPDADRQLLAKLGLQVQPLKEPHEALCES